MNAKQEKRFGLTNFNKSFKARVRLPRDGKPCCLHRHYRGALRQVVSRLDYLAGLDEAGERFVFATATDLQKHCKDFKTKTTYSARFIEACLQYLRGRGVISKYEQRDRNGVTVGGRIVDEHGRITEIIGGKVCTFCSEKMAAASVGASVCASGPASVHASVGASGQNEKCFGVSPSECFGDSQPEANRDKRDTAVEEKFCKDDSQSFACSNSGKSIENIESSESSENKIPDQPEEPTSLSSDLTKQPGMNDLTDKETVGKHLEGKELTLESLLDLISDGEFETPALQKYESCPQLKDACLEVVERFKDEPMCDRTICLRMFKAMMNECERQGFPWPRGCPKVRKILEQGRPIRLISFTAHNALLQERYERGEITQEQYADEFDWREVEQEVKQREQEWLAAL